MIAHTLKMILRRFCISLQAICLLLGQLVQAQEGQPFNGEIQVLPEGFLSSCVDWGTLMNERYKLAAYCKTLSGKRQWSVLNLNDCLVNSQGQLVPQDK